MKSIEKYLMLYIPAIILSKIGKFPETYGRERILRMSWRLEIIANIMKIKSNGIN